MEFPQPPTADRLFPGRHSSSRSRGIDYWGLVRIAVWAVLYCVFYFAQQVAELFAPLLLVLGIGWGALPYIVRAITNSTVGADPQAHDVISHVASAIPDHLMVAGHYLTPSSLVFDGFLFMALAAIGATLAAIAARSM